MVSFREEGLPYVSPHVLTQHAGYMEKNLSEASQVDGSLDIYALPLLTIQIVTK